MTFGWSLARTRSLSEYLASAALERNGFETYLPRVRTPKPRAGHADAPLFPGYLFVRQDWNGTGPPPIRHIAGIVGWVQFDGTVPTVSDQVITQLDRRLEEINEGGGHWARYRPGEMVRVILGSMESLGQVLEEPKTPQARVRVLLSIMGGLVPARVPWHDLKPIERDSAHLRGPRLPRRTRGKGRWVRGFGPRAIAGASTSRLA